MIGNTYTESRTVRTDECGPENRMTLASVMGAFQHVVATHTDLCGIGFSDLKKQGLKWVIVKIRFEIDGLPRYGDGITVSTWTEKPGAFRFGRDFELKSGGAPCVGAYSDWCVLDGNEKIVSTDRLACPYSEHRADRVCGRFAARGLKTESAEPVYSRVMRYSDLDLNGHVNNVSYIRFALDCFTAGELSTPPRSLEMNYRAQAYEGDELTLSRADDGDRSFVEAKTAAGTVFTAAFNY